MESFYKEISARLESKSLEFSQHIEPQHKKIIGNSYRCMAECYDNQESIEESSRCAERCHKNVQQVHVELQQVVENIQSFFQNCLQSCRIEHSKDEGNLKECIRKCTDQASSKFGNAKSIAQEIVKKYS